MTEIDDARELLLAELREHALVIGEVTLSSGETAQYYVDAKRALAAPRRPSGRSASWSRRRPRSAARPPSAG